MTVISFPIGLPSSTRLLTLKEQAKDLYKSVEAREGVALDRIKPYFAGPSSLTLQRAQLVIARERGFSSWRKLRAFIDDRDALLAHALPNTSLGRRRELLRRRGALRRRIATEIIDGLDDGDKDAPRRCCFCFKSQHEVLKFIAGTGVYICDECVHLCRQIIDRPRPDIPPEPGDEVLRCNFCDKSVDEVPNLIRASADNICNECLELCVEIIEEATPG